MNRDLWVEYRRTWEAFSQKLYQLQELTDSGETARTTALSTRDALEEVKLARLQHNAARDRLAKSLAARKAAANTQEEPEHRIRTTARLLWEFSGKPKDTAESDWHRAEQLVRGASA